MRLVLLLALALTAAGCSTKLEVQSDTCWQGSVNAQRVSGCGNTTYGIRGGSSHECYWFVLKSTDCGYDCGHLRARLKGWNADSRWVEWSPQHPVVWVCAGN